MPDQIQNNPFNRPPRIQPSFKGGEIDLPAPPTDLRMTRTICYPPFSDVKFHCNGCFLFAYVSWFWNGIRLVIRDNDVGTCIIHRCNDFGNHEYSKA